MKIGTPREVFEGESRVAMTPDSALQLQKLGFDCVVETGAGSAAGFSDEAYVAAGVEIAATAAALWLARLQVGPMCRRRPISLQPGPW